MDRQARKARVKQKLDQLVEELFNQPHPPRTIDQIEAAALRLRQQAGQIVAQELAEEQAEAAEPEGKTDCACGRTAWEKGRPHRYLVTLAGTLSLRRRYFHCRRCDAGFCPADAVLALSEGAYSQRVVQEVAALGATLPYAAAVRTLGRLTGVSVSAKEGQRLTEQAGQRAQCWQAERQRAAQEGGGPAVPAPALLYLQADGVQTPLLDGWHEMKIGLCQGLDAKGALLGPTRYVSHLGEAEPFGPCWYALAVEAGLNEAERVVVLGDGAAWLWKLASLYFPGAVQVLDFWHAAQYLGEVSRAAFGADSAEGAAWRKERQTELWEAEWEALEEALEALASSHPQASESVAATLGYYQNQRCRMDYPGYRRQGLSIGSGAVESGCKRVVTQRLKGAGMRWRAQGAQWVASLRCLLLGGQWESFLARWSSLPAPA